MNATDAQLGRKVMTDELETVNQYEAMADNAADPGVADVIRDIADEEKVHAGEAAAIVGQSDDRAEPAMKEGLEEAQEMLGVRPLHEEMMIIAKSSFSDMISESFEKKGRREAKTGVDDKRKKWDRESGYSTGAYSTTDEFREQNRRGRQGVTPEGRYQEKKMNAKRWVFDPVTGLPWPTRDINIRPSEVDRRWVMDAIKRGNLTPVYKDKKFIGAKTQDGRMLSPQSVVERLEAMGIDRSPASNFDFSRRDLWDFLATKKDNWASDIAEEQSRLDALPENERTPWESAEENIANRYLDEANEYFTQEYARRHPDKERNPDIRHISDYYTATGTVLPYMNYERPSERKYKERQKAVSRPEVVAANEEEVARENAIRNSDLYFDLLLEKMDEYMAQGKSKEEAYADAQSDAFDEASAEFKTHRDAINQEQANFANQQTQIQDNMDKGRVMQAQQAQQAFQEDPELYRSFKDVYSSYDPSNLNSLMFTPEQREVLGRGLGRYGGMSAEDLRTKGLKGLARYAGEKGFDPSGVLPTNEAIQAVVDEWSKVRTGDKASDEAMLGKMLGEAGIRTRNIGAALGDVMSGLNVPTTEGAQKDAEWAKKMVSQGTLNEQLPVTNAREQAIRDKALELKGGQFTPDGGNVEGYKASEHRSSEKTPEEIAGLINDKTAGISDVTTTPGEVEKLTAPKEERSEIIDRDQKKGKEEARKKREAAEAGRKQAFDEKQKKEGDSPEKHQTSKAPAKLVPGGGKEVKESDNIEKSASFADMFSDSIMKKDSEKGHPPMSNDQLMKDPYRHVWMTENEPIYDGEMKVQHGNKQGDKVTKVPDSKIDGDIKKGGVTGVGTDGVDNAIMGDKVSEGVTKSLPSFSDLMFEKANGTSMAQTRAHVASGLGPDGPLAEDAYDYYNISEDAKQSVADPQGFEGSEENRQKAIGAPNSPAEEYESMYDKVREEYVKEHPEAVEKTRLGLMIKDEHKPIIEEKVQDAILRQRTPVQSFSELMAGRSGFEKTNGTQMAVTRRNAAKNLQTPPLMRLGDDYDSSKDDYLYNSQLDAEEQAIGVQSESKEGEGNPHAFKELYRLKGIDPPLSNN